MQVGVYSEVPFGLDELRISGLSAGYHRRANVFGFFLRQQAHDDLGILQFSFAWSHSFMRNRARASVYPLFAHAKKGILGSDAGIGIESIFMWRLSDHVEVGYTSAQEPHLNRMEHGSGRHGGLVSLSTGRSTQYRFLIMVEQRADLGLNMVSRVTVSPGPGLHASVEWRSDTGSIALSTAFRLAYVRTLLGTGWHPALGLSHGYGFEVFR